MVSSAFPLNKELVEMLFPRELGPRKWENEEIGAVCTRVKSLPPAIMSDLTDDTEDVLPIDGGSMGKTTILFKSWINWAGMAVSWRSLSNVTSRVSGRVT